MKRSIGEETLKTRSKAPVPTERQEQALLIDWWGHYARSKGLDERLLFAIPNGAVLAGDAKRRAIQMRNLKATGLRVGMLDLMLAVPRLFMDVTGAWVSKHHGLFVEMKRQDGRPSPEQLSIAATLIKTGYSVKVCKGADQAMQAIKDYLA